MNQKFSLKRIGLLLRRYFIENQNYEIYLWSILTIVFMIFRNGNSAGAILIGVGAVYAVRFFKVFNYTPNGATVSYGARYTGRKNYFSTAAQYRVFLSLMFSIVFSVGNLIGNFLEKIIYGLSDPVASQFFILLRGLNLIFKG